VRQTPGLLFTRRCKFSDSGFAARIEKAHSAAYAAFLCSCYGELCAGGFGLPVPFPGLQTCVRLATFRFAAWVTNFHL